MQIFKCKVYSVKARIKNRLPLLRKPILTIYASSASAASSTSSTSSASPASSTNLSRQHLAR